MTLLNKPFKNRASKKKVEKKAPSQLEKPIVPEGDISRVNDYVNFALWSLSILVFLSVLGTAAYSLLVLNERNRVVMLYSTQPEKDDYRSKPSVSEVYVYDVPRTSPDFSDVEAASVFAFNPVTQQVYYSSQIDQNNSIASITKLLTVLVASEHFEKDDLLVVPDGLPIIDWRLGLKPGDRITFENAVKAMMINSFNDVAFVVAENHPHGYESFVDEMNQKALSIGMEESKFQNPAGLDDPEHYSTSRDLKRLVQMSIKNKLIIDNVQKDEEIIQIERKVSLDAYVVENIKLTSTNELLAGSDPTIVGLKTGYTSAAGQSFIGFFRGEGNDQLITIILNANGNRFDETMDLVTEIRSVF